MSKYIPFPFYADDVPIDLSFVYKDEKPAGKHGFLKVVGDHFEFEDGTVARFWGTNLNGGANFPEFDYSEKLAKRLAKIGINLVRFHQLDAEWDTPNIFNFTKGPRCSKTTEFDVESMKRLDYLIYCLKKEGIYCYMDMFTYRKFKSGDGVENAHLLGDAAKPYANYSRPLIELQKKLAYDLWTHVNSYTGLAYKDDPVFVMAEIVNESDLFHSQAMPIEVEPYASEFRQLLKRWLSEQGIDYDADNCDINNPDDSILIQFKIYLQEKYYIEMLESMREIGVKIPITGTNWLSTPANVKTQLVTDFIDSHTYFYQFGKWGEFTKHCENRALTQTAEPYLIVSAMNSVIDRPLYVSEWDMPWPNEYRAESPIYVAAIGALQGWSGFAIHTYSYCSSQERMNMLGKEVSSSKIGNTPYREGIFSTWNDPAKFGLFYHAALITRRGDVSPANNKFAVKAESMSKWNNAAFLALEVSKVSSQFDDRNIEGVTYIKEPIVDLSKGEVCSDTGQLYRNWEKNYGTIDTPMTKCAYGFLGKNSPIELDGFKVSCKTDFSVIALSSLTDDHIEKSENMLLTAVGRAKNTDAVFEEDQMLDYGKPPVLIEVIEAEIEIKTSIENLKVWAVNAEGFYIGTVPTTYDNGVLKIKLGEISYSMYYLIQAE
jgi:hypothetical protein